MAALVENIVALEKEADAIVAQARTEAKEIEKSAIGEAESYRRRLAEDTEKKVTAFKKEMEEKHQRSVAETQKELGQTLDAIDQIEGDTLKKQIDKILTRFGEL